MMQSVERVIHMLDMQFVRENPDEVKRAIDVKGEHGVDVDELLKWDEDWRGDLHQLESMRARRNRTSKEIGEKKRAGEDAAELIEKMRSVNEEIDRLEKRVRQLEKSIESAMLRLPNTPHHTVPVGEDEDDNQVADKWGDIPRFSFDASPHWELGRELGIMDFERAAKIAGSRFSVLCAEGAQLERALINFMLDLHIREHGYTEVLPPYLVNRNSMIGTGQLPKFEEDAFLVNDYDYFLIPTAEVPVTNLYRDEILDSDDLPMKFASYTACFRAEAGSAGRDTRGLIRQHQFNKVELVHYTEPGSSYEALEEIRQHAEVVLQRLGIPYRVTVMCTGDMGFAQSKKYDLEIWMPSYEDYVEISSVSNYESFQARRANIRYRPEPESKTEFIHTLNGSGVAIGRCLAAIIENFQNEDGTVTVPECLRPYMAGMKLIGG